MPHRIPKRAYTKPVNFRKRYYRILEAAGIEQKGLHFLRHAFATNLVNGVKQSDGTNKALSPRQVADCFTPLTREINSLTDKIQGTGLGMAITKNPAELMGGTIKCQEQEGRGNHLHR